MNNLKKLHLSTNLDDLEKQSRISDTKMKDMLTLLRTGRKLHEAADKAFLEGDEEVAYILYTRYFNLLHSIHKKPDYHSSKTLIRTMLGDNRKNMKMMDRLEDITKSLRERYFNLNQPNILSMSTQKTDNCANPNLNSHRSRSISPIPSENTVNNRLMTCEQLYNMMCSNNVLIMDCRSSKDYKTSHLSYPLCLNVASDIIQAGMSAGRLQDKLDADSKVLWSARAVKDQVVLMDWNCARSDPPRDTPISILLDILQNWDPDVTYRSTIKILENGYEYFIIMYPHLCSNPTVRSSQTSTLTNASAELELIEYIEYPSVNDIQLKDDIIAKSQQQQQYYCNLANKQISTHQMARPLIDRSSKSAAIKIYDEKQKALEQIKQEQEILLEKAQKNDQQLKQANEQCLLQCIYEKPQLERTVAEQQLFYNLIQLESIAEDYRNEVIRLRDELAQYTAKREEEDRGTLPSQIAKEVEQTAKQIEDKFKERQLLDDQMKRERQQRVLLHNQRDSTRQIHVPRKAISNKQNEYNKENFDRDGGSPPLLLPPPSPPPKFDRSVKPLPPHIIDSESHIIDNNELQQRQRDFSPIHGTVRRGLTGLKNLGNTCYMNSIIQCLSHTPQLAEYCISDKYKNYISRNNKTKGQVIEEVAALIKVLWKGTYKCVSSKDLRYVIGQYQKMFRGLEQQDSHEFLTILMDWLHSDLQTLPVADYTKEPITASDKAWLDFTKAKESLILNLFYGQIKSIVKCATCDKESATYDCFSNLSLELPENNNTCSLIQCLDMYFSGERIYGWNCPSCKCTRDAIKKLNVAKLPAVLVIHLKRFSAEHDSTSLCYKKKQNFLRFPLNSLDMHPYIAVGESKRSTPKLYQLYAVSNHYGSMESGHYTAFCKSDMFDRWFKFDDQVVTPLDSSNVISSAAYILFYTRLPPLQSISEN